MIDPARQLADAELHQNRAGEERDGENRQTHRGEAAACQERDHEEVERDHPRQLRLHGRASHFREELATESVEARPLAGGEGGRDGSHLDMMMQQRSCARPDACADPFSRAISGSNALLSLSESRQLVQR
jgi:hypothetical protein